MMTFFSDRAPIDDVLAWGESIDHLLECKSKLTSLTPLSPLSPPS